MFFFFTFTEICKPPKIIFIQKDTNELFVVSEKSFSLVYKKKDEGEVKWLDYDGKDEIYRNEFKDNLKNYLIGVATPCGVTWATCFYQFSSENNRIKPIIFSKNNRVFIEFNQDCVSGVFYHKAILTIFKNNRQLDKGKFFFAFDFNKNFIKVCYFF